MKLELKHLAPYLPYKLKCEVLNSGKETEIGEMIAVYDDGSACFGNIVESDKGFEYFKPILRPLSDLSKEIEHNGDRFVPIDKWEWGRFKKISTLESAKLCFIQLREYELLIEHHFDIFGLIDNGLAIDINTL